MEITTRVRSSSSINGGFCCPLCDDQQNYDYTRLLRHAIQTAEGSSSSGKQRVKHAAMARYLAIDLADEDQQSSDLDEGPFIKRRKTKSSYKSKAAETPGSVNAQKVAMAEKREKEALKKVNEMKNEMNALITKERNSRDELEKVLKELMKEKAPNDNSCIGVKKIGELDVNVFKRACEKRFPVGEAEIRGVELRSKWQQKLPSLLYNGAFRRIYDNKGNYKKVLNDKNATLCGLKNEWGDEAYNAVVMALMDLHGYDEYESVKEDEIWNFKENRKANLEEVISWLRSGRKELLESRYVVVSIN